MTLFLVFSFYPLFNIPSLSSFFNKLSIFRSKIQLNSRDPQLQFSQKIPENFKFSNFYWSFIKIINLQKQVANHVRFIDDHCVDSEEIRTEMQKDIDRLVAQLEDQEKQNRTTSSLQTQVQRLEGNFLKKKHSIPTKNQLIFKLFLIQKYF